MSLNVGKARRLKQAKEEAQADIEKYRQEREKGFKDFEAKVRPKTLTCLGTLLELFQQTED